MPKTIYNVTLLTLILLLCEINANKLPWDKWSWAVPQEPIEYFFRRHKQMPIKNPNPQCQCPPHKECTIDYKLNEDALHFQRMQGLINNTEISKEVEEIRRSVYKNTPDKGCCCPITILMIPAYISARKFDDFVDRFDKKISLK